MRIKDLKPGTLMIAFDGGRPSARRIAFILGTSSCPHIYLGARTIKVVETDQNYMDASIDHAFKVYE